VPPGGSDVTVHVASLDTCAATELSIRSMRRFAGHRFDLVVGDSGSRDGSVAMLERHAAAGWLRLEQAPEGRKHWDWLDRWLAACPTRYACFADSDIEYRRDGWLADMVGVAAREHAALVCCRLLPRREEFVHPVTGATRPLAPRPAAWLFLVDVEQVRGRVDASFRYREEPDPQRPGSLLAYDTGAWYFHQLEAAGLGWAEMPASWQSSYRHFGGLSWLGPRRAGASLRVRAKQAAKVAIVAHHLRRARRAGWGETPPG
jgi:hypothetical protein